MGEKTTINKKKEQVLRKSDGKGRKEEKKEKGEKERRKERKGRN